MNFPSTNYPMLRIRTQINEKQFVFEYVSFPLMTHENISGSRYFLTPGSKHLNFDFFGNHVFKFCFCVTKIIKRSEICFFIYFGAWGTIEEIMSD